MILDEYPFFPFPWSNVGETVSISSRTFTDRSPLKIVARVIGSALYIPLTLTCLSQQYVLTSSRDQLSLTDLKMSDFTRISPQLSKALRHLNSRPQQNRSHLANGLFVMILVSASLRFWGLPHNLASSLHTGWSIAVLAVPALAWLAVLVFSLLLFAVTFFIYWLGPLGCVLVCVMKSIH